MGRETGRSRVVTVAVVAVTVGVAAMLWGTTRPDPPPEQRTDRGFEPTGLGWNTRARRNARRSARRHPHANAALVGGFASVMLGMWSWVLVEDGWDWSARSPMGVPMPVVLVATPPLVAWFAHRAARLWRQGSAREDADDRGRPPRDR